MLEERTILSRLSIEIPREEALRLLGVTRRSPRRPRASMMRLLEEEEAQAAALVEPRAILRLSAAGLPGSHHLPSKEPLAAAVCTIGRSLEERVAALLEGGESSRAMILDALGSAAAEATADLCNQQICQQAVQAGHAPRRRRSPGYGRWDIREQRALLDFLEPEEIGVTLSSTSMMIPRKSISFVVPLVGGTPERAVSRCARCGLLGCPFRDEDRASAPRQGE